MLSKSKKSEIRDPRTSHRHLRHGPRNSLAVGGHVYFANWLYYFLVALQRNPLHFGFWRQSLAMSFQVVKVLSVEFRVVLFWTMGQRQKF